ncbi:MAG: hypothetical protein ACI85F_001176 [Bacteroidia bacterium]|jgi:hypothetical protein
MTLFPQSRKLVKPIYVLLCKRDNLIGYIVIEPPVVNKTKLVISKNIEVIVAVHGSTPVGNHVVALGSTKIVSVYHVGYFTG